MVWWAPDELPTAPRRLDRRFMSRQALGTITRGDATQQVMSDQRSDGVTKTGPGHLTRSLTGESSGNKPSF